MVFRVYVTDSLQGLPQQKYPVRRWYDLIRLGADERIDPEAVVRDVADRAGLVIL